MVTVFTKTPLHEPVLLVEIGHKKTSHAVSYFSSIRKLMFHFIYIQIVKIDDNNCEGSECRLSVGVLAAIVCGAVIIPLSCLVAVAGCVVKLRLQKLKKSENIL